MTPDPVMGIVQAALVGMQAAWLTLGAYENVRSPEINRDAVARVLALGALEELPDPEVARRAQRRRIEDPRHVRTIFAGVVVMEALTAVALWCAAALLLGAALGGVDPELARDAGLIAVLAFTSIWGLFLIIGQWFFYWLAAYGQSTHFMLLLWGIGTILVLA